MAGPSNTTGRRVSVVFGVLVAAVVLSGVVASGPDSSHGAVLPWPEGWSVARTIGESSPYVDGFGAVVRTDGAVGVAWAVGDNRERQAVRFAWLEQAARRAGTPAWISLAGEDGSGGGRLERPVVLSAASEGLAAGEGSRRQVAQVLWLSRTEGGGSRLWRAVVGGGPGAPKLLKRELLRQTDGIMTGLTAALGSRGTLHAVWAEVHDGNFELVHGSWDEKVRLLGPIGRVTRSKEAESGRAVLAWGGDDRGRLAWLEAGPTRTEAWFAVLRADGSLEDTPFRLGSADERDKRGPSVALLGGNRTAVVWSRAVGGYSSSSQLWLVLIDAAGLPESGPTAMPDLSGYSFAPFAATLPEKAAGRDSREEAVAIVFSSDALRGVRTFYGRLGAVGSWLKSPVAVDVSPSGSAFPWVGVDAEGNIHAVWAEFRRQGRYALVARDTVTPSRTPLIRKAGIDEAHAVENIILLTVINLFAALSFAFANAGLVAVGALVLWLWRRVSNRKRAAWMTEATAFFGLLFVLQAAEDPLFVARGAGGDSGLAVFAAAVASAGALLFLRAAGMNRRRWEHWWTAPVTGLVWLFFDQLILSLPVSLRWL